MLSSVKNLDSIDTLKRPFSMIFDRLKTKFLPLFLSGKHAVVTTITKAVPLFPSQIKWFLQIPWTINGTPTRSKITVLRAFVPHASSLLTLINTSSVKPAISNIKGHEVNITSKNLLQINHRYSNFSRDSARKAMQISETQVSPKTPEGRLGHGKAG